jgi:hypothetical protein
MLLQRTRPSSALSVRESRILIAPACQEDVTTLPRTFVKSGIIASLDFPCPNRALSRTCADPPERFFFCLSPSPTSPCLRRAAASPGSLAGFHVCLVYLRPLGGLSFLEAVITQIPRIRNENVDNMQKRPEFRAFRDALARPRLRPPTAAPAGPATR